MKAEKGASPAYTELPVLPVSVGSEKGTITTLGAVTCSLGGSSVPIVVTYDAMPIYDVNVKITTVEYDTTVATPVDPSSGLTPNVNKVTLNSEF